MKNFLLWLYKMKQRFFPLFFSVFYLIGSISSAQAIQLKRTSFGSHVGAEVTWEVDSAVTGFLATNLRDGKEYNANDLGCASDGNIFKCKFTKAGIYKIKVDGTNEILQIIAPEPNEIKGFDKPNYFTACSNSDDFIYDVIVVDGTSAGVGAAITAVNNKLNTCLLESTSLVGGMFTNGIGISDIGVDSQAGLEKPASTGLLYGFMKDFAEAVKNTESVEKVLLKEHLENIGNGNHLAMFEAIDEGLIFPPSIARDALYNLIKKSSVIKKEDKNYFLHITPNSTFSEINYDKNKKEYTVIDSSGNKYKATYIIDATDSGDAAVAYHVNKTGKSEVELFNESMSDSGCIALNNTDATSNNLNGLLDVPTTPPSSPFCVRFPTQAYSHVMTITPYENDIDNWSYMGAPPPDCNVSSGHPYLGNEGRYSPSIYKRNDGEIAWTFNTGRVGADVYQVKHHSKLGIQSIKDHVKYLEGKSLINPDVEQNCLNKQYLSESEYEELSKKTLYSKLGDELIDCDTYGTGVKTGFAINSSVRSDISERYLNHTMCFLYHVQHNPQTGEIAGKSIGLNKNEDPVRGNFPSRMYVREGRRINGKATFYGSDTLKRKLLEDDSLGDLLNNSGRPSLSKYSYQGVGITGYTMDSHGTSPAHDPEGKFSYNVMSSSTGVGVIPLGVMIPSDIPNMLVPLAMSSSAWGYTTLRMDPVRANMGQVAALAISFIKDKNNSIQDIDELLMDKVSLIKFQKFLLENGGKFFLYKDKEFQDIALETNTENKKAHIAAQFLGIWEIMSGYGVKDVKGGGYPLPEKAGLEGTYDKGGYILGYDKYLNRVEMIKITLLAGKFAGNPKRTDVHNTCNTSSFPFLDVNEDNWGCGYITYAKNKKIIEGLRDQENKLTNKYNPFDNATWGGTAKMAINSIFGNHTPQLGTAKHWHIPYLSCLSEMVPDVYNGEINNNPPITRGKAAQVIFKLIEYKLNGGMPNCNTLIEQVE